MRTSQVTVHERSLFLLQAKKLNDKKILREFGSAWHKITNILLFFEKFVIFGFKAGKSQNLIGLGRFQGAQDFFDP